MLKINGLTGSHRSGEQETEGRSQETETGLSLSAAYERFDNTTAANRDAISGERVQEIVKERVKNLLGERLFSGQAKIHGQFLRDGEAHCIRNRAAATVGLISQRDRRLHHCTGTPINIKLAARQPAHICRIGGLEHQQTRL